MADVVQKITDQAERVDEQALAYEKKVGCERQHIEVMQAEIKEKDEKIGELKNSIAENEPNKKKCVEQILNAKKRLSADTPKVVNAYLQKHSYPVTVQMLERLVGMLQGKGGVAADRIGVELYFKSIEGLVRSIEEFNYKDVRKEVAEENKGFAQLIKSDDSQDKAFSLVAELHHVYIEKESSKVDHFITLHALMMAHSNLVIVSTQDEDCNKYIAKFEGQRESA